MAPEEREAGMGLPAQAASLGRGARHRAQGAPLVQPHERGRPEPSIGFPGLLP